MTTQTSDSLRIVEGSFIQTTGTRSAIVEWTGHTPTQAAMVELVDPHAPGNFGVRVDWIAGKQRALVEVFVD